MLNLSGKVIGVSSRIVTWCNSARTDPVDCVQPDATLINIGTNDYSLGDPGPNYRLAMHKLINRVQSDFPGKPVYLIVSPMITGTARDSQKKVLASLAGNNVSVLDLGQTEPGEGYGCDYHPDIATHARMSDALVKQLKRDLHW